MSSNDFQSKWGTIPNENSKSDQTIYLVLHAVILFVLFMFIRPSFLTVQSRDIEMPNLCLIKSAFLSITVSICTYIAYCHCNNVSIKDQLFFVLNAGVENI